MHFISASYNFTLHRFPHLYQEYAAEYPPEYDGFPLIFARLEEARLSPSEAALLKHWSA
jgi:hypothetical protein